MFLRACTGLVTLLAGSSLYAVEYTFQKIVDTSGPLSSFQMPAANSSGEVAFVASRDAGGAAVYKYSGGTLTALKDSTSGYTSFGSNLDINDAGNVVYAAANNTASGMFLNNATAPMVSGAAYDFNTNDGVALNNAGQYAYVRASGTNPGYYRATIGGSAMRIRSDADMFIFVFTRLGINASGSVVYPATNFSGVTTIYREDGWGAVPMADSTGPLERLNDPVVNTAGDVLFRSDRDAGGGTGLYLKQGPTLYELVNSDGPFAGVLAAAMNGAGTYAFFATMDDGTNAIYAGQGTSYSPLVSSTSNLLGAGLSSVRLMSNGIADNGNIAFRATFDDGSSAIYLASPVPEPSVILTGGVVISMMLARRQRKV